jgi:hypothetical protein
MSNFGYRGSGFQSPRFLAVVAAVCSLAFVLASAFAVGYRETQAGSQSALASSDAILSEMSQITGLPIRAPLKKRMIGRPEVEKYLVENLHAEYTPAELHAQQAALQAFGLVSREFDLEKFLITFYTEQAAGFYDPRRKTMFIADWVGEDMQNMVLAHELTHALQDQNFDLETFLHAVRADDDATNARQAIVEGYATAAMMEHLVRPLDLAGLPSLEPLMGRIVHQQMEEFPAFSSAPYFFRVLALFPYTQGMAFMQRGLAQGGWKKLITLFSNPPATTKQIFEPQAYFEHQPAPSLALPRPEALSSIAGMRVVAENVMGELGYYALLGQFISEQEAKSLGAGWIADRYIVFEGPARNQYSLVARTLWSSPETARAFFRDYRSILGKKYPELAPDQRSEADLFVGKFASGNVILLRREGECLWAEGVPTAQTDALLGYFRVLSAGLSGRGPQGSVDRSTSRGSSPLDEQPPKR